MADLTRTYNVPLRRGYINAPNYKKTNKAVRTLRDFVIKHMKSDDVLLGRNLNEHMWKNGKKNPPHHVKIDCVKNSEGTVKVELHGKKYEEAVKSVKTEETGLKEKLASKLIKQPTEKKEDEGKDASKEESKKAEAKTEEKKTSGTKETTKTETKKETAAKQTKAKTASK